MKEKITNIACEMQDIFTRLTELDYELKSCKESCYDSLKNYSNSEGLGPISLVELHQSINKTSNFLSASLSELFAACSEINKQTDGISFSQKSIEQKHIDHTAFRRKQYTFDEEVKEANILKFRFQKGVDLVELASLIIHNSVMREALRRSKYSSLVDYLDTMRLMSDSEFSGDITTSLFTEYRDYNLEGLRDKEEIIGVVSEFIKARYKI